MKTTKKMKTSKQKKTLKFKKQKIINYHLFIYAAIFILILTGAYLLYTLVKSGDIKEDIAGKAWGDDIHDQLLLVTHGDDGLFVNPDPAPEHPSDFTGSIHYNWKKRVAEGTKSITVVDLPMESVVSEQITGQTGIMEEIFFVNNLVTDKKNSLLEPPYLQNFVTNKGILGNALYFDGDNEYVKIGDTTLTLNNDFTIEMWFSSNGGETLLPLLHNLKAEDSLKNNFIIFLKDTDNKHYITAGWFGYDNSDNPVPLGDLTKLAQIQSEYAIDTFNHFTAVFDKESNILNVYLNGDLIGMIDYNLLEFSFGSLNGPFYLGRQFNLGGLGNIGFFNGLIDEFKLYDIALTPEQVKANYDSVIDSATGQLKDTAHYTAYNTLVPNMNKDCGKWEVDGYWFRETGAFEDRITTNELDTLCPQGSVCQDGVCVEEQLTEGTTCTPDCTGGQCIIKDAIIEPPTSTNTCVLDTVSCNFIGGDTKITIIKEGTKLYSIQDLCVDSDAYDFSCGTDNKGVIYTKTICQQGQTCVDGTCVGISQEELQGLGLGESKEFTLDGTCIKVTLTAINDMGNGDTSDDTFDFEIGECEAATGGAVTQPALTLTREDTGDFVASTTIPDTFTPTVGSVHYNWLYSKPSFVDADGNIFYESMTLLNLPMETTVKDISGNSDNIVKLLKGTANVQPIQTVPSDLVTEGIIGKATKIGTVDVSQPAGSVMNYIYSIENPDVFSSAPDDFTVDFWVKAAADSSGPLLYANPLLLFYFSKGVVFIDDYDGNGNKLSTYCGGQTSSALSFGQGNDGGAWNNIVIVYKDNKFNIKINNNDYCEFDYTTPIIFTNLIIGRDKDYTFLQNTAIDEFKIYTKALTSEQISANYNSVMETTTTDGVVTTAPKTDASTNAYTKISVAENKECMDWKVTATLFDENGNEIVITPQLEALSVDCAKGVCNEGLCVDVVNCIDNSACANNAINTKCLNTNIEKNADGSEKICAAQNAGNNVGQCSDGYFCNEYIQKCVKEGTCVNVECLINAECTDPAKPNCVNNICTETTPVDTGNTDATPPSDTGSDSSTGGSSGGSSGGGSDECMLPQDSVKCHAQKAYTPCVQDKIIYTCLSKCGTSLLFQYDCKGNTPSYAQGCNNKIKDIGEEGVDCGGKCAVKCPDYCFNNKKDADEYGIDCGGKKCTPCEEPIVKKEAPIITQQQTTQPTTVTPPVLETPLFDKIKGYWWTLIPFLLIIGLIVFLITRTQHPHQEVVQGIEQPEEFRKPFKGAEPPKETREEHSMKQLELKDFIKKELSGGKDREEITKNLERIGYNIDDINSVFDEGLHEALPKEYEQQLRKYVSYYLDKGSTPEEIREKLKVQGWSDEVIDKFLVR